MSSTTSSFSPVETALPGERFAGRALLRATGFALVASIAGVLAIRGVTGVLSDVPSAFTPLAPASIVSLTVLGVVAAALFALALNRLSARPATMFRRAVPIAVTVSFVPDVAIWVGNAYSGTAKASTVLPLMLMHLVVAGICLAVLPRLGTRPAR
jgi:hypothetical protein